MVLYCFPTNEGMVSHDLGPGPWICACFIFHSFYWTCIDWQTHTYLPNALQHADYSWVAYRLIWKLLALKSNKSCDRSQRAETDNRTTHALSLDPATTHISYTFLGCKGATGECLRLLITVTSTVHCQVFVSDCDHTLWNGIVSEDGVHGLKFSAPYLELQRKLSELQKALFVGQLLGKTVKTSGVLLRPRKEYGFV